MADPTPLQPLIYRLVKRAVAGAVAGLTTVGQKLKWLGNEIVTVAGATMTGRFDFNVPAGSHGVIHIKVNDIEKGVAPSVDKQVFPFVVQDKNGKNLAACLCQYNRDRTMLLKHSVYQCDRADNNASVSTELRMTAEGVATFTAPQVSDTTADNSQVVTASDLRAAVPASTGGPMRPVYVDGNGVIQKCNADIAASSAADFVATDIGILGVGMIVTASYSYGTVATGTEKTLDSSTEYAGSSLTLAGEAGSGGRSVYVPSTGRTYSAEVSVTKRRLSGTWKYIGAISKVKLGTATMVNDAPLGFTGYFHRIR